MGSQKDLKMDSFSIHILWKHSWLKGRRQDRKQGRQLEADSVTLAVVARAKEWAAGMGRNTQGFCDSKSVSRWS